VHVFTLVALVATLGALVALRRVRLLRGHARHLLGVTLLLVFSSGLLGLWRPSAAVGAVDLGVTSAGGDLGRWFTNGWLVGAAWLLALPAGFALLWPRTAVRALRAAPGEAARDGAWLWGHGPRQGIAALGARLQRFGEPDVPEHVPDVAALDPFHERRAPNANGDCDQGGCGADHAAPAATALPAVPREDEREAADAVEDERPAVQMPMDLEHGVAAWRHSSDGWQLPPIDVLRESEPIAPELQDNARRARLIVDTLASFGVDAAVTQINEGPAVTQFGVEPGWDVRTRNVVERDAEGNALLDATGQPRTKHVEVSRTRIRVNRITSLQNDLALALAAPALRIEAPVPGQSVIGIEVPNAQTSIVTLRSVIESPAFAQSATKQHLPVALGSAVTGASAVTDLAEMPHLLIAGATGSGKSVCLNAIIACLLMNYSPEQLRLVLIDPKRVELTAFADIPHLAFSDIVVDMDKVVGTLQAVIHEMESRYRAFAKLGVRNLQTYNERNEGRPLPYWVVVIDELADLMLAAPYQVEHQLVRLAQLARATGIHLVVATQRPSVDVVTGLIKANFPTRVAFAVASQVDSRTVLDSGGAEKLLGRGDMLYQPKDQQKPTRLQGVYVSDEEIAAVVDFWTADRFDALKPPRHDDLLAEAEREAADLVPGGPPPTVDPMVTQALELAREHEQISTSLLQRRLRIGYPRAARVMDELEDRGVVGAPEGGGGSRPVLLGSDDAPAEEPVGAAEREPS
jgi:S-DNA-T family DNA segregation ATPase FtsK/SpoIIIE